MKRELRTVQRAATRKRDHDAAYRAAIVAARSAGASLHAIGLAAGVTRQAVGQLLDRIPKEDASQ